MTSRSSSLVTRRAVIFFVFFFQAEDGIRDLVRSRGLGDVYKRQVDVGPVRIPTLNPVTIGAELRVGTSARRALRTGTCLLYTSDAADERSSVDLGGRRIIKKKNRDQCTQVQV